MTSKIWGFHRDFMLIYLVTLVNMDVIPSLTRWNVVDLFMKCGYFVLDWLYNIFGYLTILYTHIHTVYQLFICLYIYICMYIYIIVCVYIYMFPFCEASNLLFFMVLPICLILQHQLFQPPPSYCTKTAPGSSVHSSFRCLVVLEFILLAPRTRQGFVEIMTWRKNFIELKNCVYPLLIKNGLLRNQPAF